MGKMFSVSQKRILIALLALSMSCPIAVVNSQESFASEPASCADGGPCAKGDIGPGGGIVFFIAPIESPTFSVPGGYGSAAPCSPNCNMLEFAPNTWAGGSSDPSFQWQEVGSPIIITENPPSAANVFTGSGALGAGKANTRRMQSVNGLTEGTIPSYGTATGTRGQWYWPSQQELVLMRNSGLNISGFGGHTYWSSTDGSETEAYGVDFGPAGGLWSSGKSNYNYVRIIRAFSATIKDLGTAPTIGSATISGTAKVGQTLTAAATSVTGRPTPTRSYQWKADGSNVGTDSNTYTIAAGDLGKAITVVILVYNTAGSDYKSSSPTAVVTASNPCAPKLCQTITFTRPANMLTTTGDQLLSATSTSGLPVVFQTYAPAVCSVVGAVGSQYVRVVPSGAPQTCVINASQIGNATFAPATWVQVGFNVNNVAQTITFNQPYSLKIGTNQTLSASSTSGLSVSYSSYTPSICTISAGNKVTAVAATTNQYCVIAATQSGNTIYAGATPVTKSLYTYK